MTGRLGAAYFAQPTLAVAADLIGRTLVRPPFYGIITETEAYRGQDDPASHAGKGQTPRNRMMFGAPAHAYIYLIYGMYHCLNFVTEAAGQPAAVLIRGLQLTSPTPQTLDGPGKLCRALNITRAENGLDISSSSALYVGDEKIPLPYTTTPRIGIKQGTDKLWRFVAA